MLLQPIRGIKKRIDLPKDGWYAEGGIGPMGGIRAAETRDQLEDRLRDLMQELGNAINESLSDSDRIAAAIGEIKRAGYDVFLVLEATIGFNKRADNDENDETEETVELESQPQSGRRRVGKIKLTSQDQKFLRDLKIAIDDDSR
jgi:hypothetical protein